MSVARAREVMARLRAAGITVHEWPGWESRGNGYTSNYEGIIIHHTATPFGYAFQALVSGRPDLSGPLCNTAGNVDGSVTMIAAHPANHAGAGSGPSLGPLPRTTLFNPRVWGHEIVYPGTVPMMAEQYRTAQILSRICVDVFGYGDVERARLHAETNGRGYEGKWDAGNGNGTTYDAAAFRRGVPINLEDDMFTDADRAALHDLRNNLALRYINSGKTDSTGHVLDRMGAMFPAIDNEWIRKNGGVAPGTMTNANVSTYRYIFEQLDKKLNVISAAIAQLAEDDATPVTLSPEQLATLRADTADAIRAEMAELETQFDTGIERLAELLAGHIGADRSVILAALSEFYGRAVKEDGNDTTTGPVS